MIHLICLGNALHADDGFGAAMAHRLRALLWPDNIRVLNGSGRFGPVDLFEHCRLAVVLEAVPPHFGAPGEIVRLDGACYQGHPPDNFRAGTGALLAAVRAMAAPPQMLVMGPVAICRRPFAPGLSPLVQAACQTMTVMLAAEFGGMRPRRSRRMTA